MMSGIASKLSCNELDFCSKISQAATIYTQNNYLDINKDTPACGSYSIDENKSKTQLENRSIKVKKDEQYSEDLYQGAYR